MNNPVFAVYDSKAKYFRNPFIMRTKGEAIRAFTDIANDEKSEINKHAEDFTLFHLGSFDEEKGIYENLTSPNSLGIAVEFKKL